MGFIYVMWVSKTSGEWQSTTVCDEIVTMDKEMMTKRPRSLEQKWTEHIFCIRHRAVSSTCTMPLLWGWKLRHKINTWLNKCEEYNLINRSAFTNIFSPTYAQYYHCQCTKWCISLTQNLETRHLPSQSLYTFPKNRIFTRDSRWFQKKETRKCYDIG
jgi:hypothetical protein